MRSFTLTRYNALRRAWMDTPPVSWLVAAYVGYKPKNEGRRAGGNETEAQRNTRAMFEMIKANGGSIPVEMTPAHF